MDEEGSAVSRRRLMQGALAALALAGLPTVAGCGSSKASAQRPGSAPPLAPVNIGLARERVALSGVADLTAVVAGMNQFGLRLHREAATMAANWTTSPLSLDVAFAMLRAGARAGTAGELDRVFGYPHVSAPSGSPHAALNALTSTLTANSPPASTKRAPLGSPGPPPVVAIANGLFLDRSFAPDVQRAFLSVLATQYGAAPTAVDFTRPGAVAQLNAWVVAQTHGRITRLFDQLDPDVKLVLANAVYLRANWASPFEAAQTANGPFTLASGRHVTARLMRQTLDFARYGAADGWQRISLPYASSDLTMRIVVPTQPARDLATLAGALAAATASTARDQSAHVELTLPRWNTSTDLDLVAPLSALGLRDLFDAHADLGGIAGGLSVSDAVHRANITVDEKGTEAAAITGIAVATSATVGAPVPMAADRPFAWAIVHEPTGTPMFTGHVVNPLI